MATFFQFALRYDPSYAPGVDFGTHIGGQANHFRNTSQGGLANGGVGVGEIQAVRRENLARRDARHLESSGRKPPQHFRQIDIARAAQGEFDAVIPERSATVHTAAEVVSHRNEGGGQRIRGGDRQPDLHSSVSSTRRCARNTISLVEIPYFAKSST